MPHPCDHAQTNPDKAAYIMAGSGEVITYGQLDRRSNRVARLFRRLGLKTGDHIAIFMENHPRYMEVVWGAQRSGLIYTGISTHLTPSEVAYIVNDCDARVVITSARLADNCKRALEDCPNVEAAYIADGAHDEPPFESLRLALSREQDTAIEDQCAGTDMLYSSGTTGRPKGVVVAHNAVAIGDVPASFQRLIEAFAMTDNTVYLSPAPLYHAAPLRFNLMVMYMGGTSIIMEKFDPEQALQAIERYRVTHSQWVPIMFSRLLDLPTAVRKRYDLSSMTVAIHAAAPCPVAVKQAMMAWWGRILHEYYSSTESIGATRVTPDEWLERPGTVGRPIVGVPHILGEDSGEELPAGKVGVIYFANSPGVTYNKAPEKTAKVRNEKGWYTCGDLGYLDEEGYLYLTDRKDFVIISGGVNIYPQETEDLLLLHPAIADAAVFGVPNRDFGQEVKAVVELKPGVCGSPQLGEDIIAYCRERISHIKCPRSVDFSDKLPRMENGKLYKKRLYDLYNSQ